MAALNLMQDLSSSLFAVNLRWCSWNMPRPLHLHLRLRLGIHRSNSCKIFPAGTTFVSWSCNWWCSLWSRRCFVRCSRTFGFGRCDPRWAYNRSRLPRIELHRQVRHPIPAEKKEMRACINYVCGTICRRAYVVTNQYLRIINKGTHHSEHVGGNRVN